jgi:hypothetical protein
MAQIRCESVSDGLRASEVLATVQDYHGRRHSIRVERDFLSQINGQWYLPMGVVHVDPRTKAVLVEFPHEPETMHNRIWVKPEMLDEPLEVHL